MKFSNIFLATLIIGVVAVFLADNTQGRWGRTTCYPAGTYGISGGVIINTHSGRVVSYRSKGTWNYTDVYGTPKEFHYFDRSEILTEE